MASRYALRQRELGVVLSADIRTVERSELP